MGLCWGQSGGKQNPNIRNEKWESFHLEKMIAQKRRSGLWGRKKTVGAKRAEVRYMWDSPSWARDGTNWERGGSSSRGEAKLPGE